MTLKDNHIFAEMRPYFYRNRNIGKYHTGNTG